MALGSARPFDSNLGAYQHTSTGAIPTPLGPRDMSIELSVVYPPRASAGAPQYVLRTTVAFQNICSVPWRAEVDGGHGLNANMLDMDMSHIGTGPTPLQCNANSRYLGNLASTRTFVGGDSVDRARTFLRDGAADGTTMAYIYNCLDINRDGVVNESDVGLLEKFLLGYIHWIPPLFPEFLGGTDNAHKLQ